VILYGLSQGDAIMRIRTHMAVTMLAAGVLLGWLAGSGRLNFDRLAIATPGPAGPLVARDEPKKERAPVVTDGKKPNIVFSRPTRAAAASLPLRQASFVLGPFRLGGCHDQCRRRPEPYATAVFSLAEGCLW
jgi:hypothetical protein